MKLFDYLATHSIPANDFAQRVGTTAATISRIANGQVMPRKALMVAILQETEGQVTPNDLFGLMPDQVGKVMPHGK
jgi:transcriptional regulator with XRE-family HTH domain